VNRTYIQVARDPDLSVGVSEKGGHHLRLSRIGLIAFATSLCAETRIVGH